MALAGDFRSYFRKRSVSDDWSRECHAALPSVQVADTCFSNFVQKWTIPVSYKFHVTRQHDPFTPKILRIRSTITHEATVGAILSASKDPIAPNM